MQLIGRYLSPFVRRVAIALYWYEIPFEHRVLSTLDQPTELQRLSRLARVPCLVLDDGEVLIDSHEILRELDRRVGPERALVPRDASQARAYGQLIALCTGSLEKAVALLYEVGRRPKELVWEEWAARLRSQMVGGLVEAESRAPSSLREDGYLFGESPTHADIAAVLALQAVSALAPDRDPKDDVPRIEALASRFGTHDVFARTAPG